MRRAVLTVLLAAAPPGSGCSDDSGSSGDPGPASAGPVKDAGRADAAPDPADAEDVVPAPGGSPAIEVPELIGPGAREGGDSE